MSNPSINKRDFVAKYGTWAVINGASDGTGAEYAKQLAELGMNIVLVARRQELLAQLSTELEATYGVQVRIACIDLSAASAFRQIKKATCDLDVGLFISNAGSAASHADFFEAPFGVWQQLINKNILVVAECVHWFGALFKRRGRGGIILMSSGSALGGQAGYPVYAGTKAFDLVFAESLWEDLAPHGVDLLSAVCATIDTPTFRRHVKPGVKFPNVFSAEEVVSTLLAKLPDGPMHIFGDCPTGTPARELQQRRIDRLKAIRELMKLLLPGHKLEE